MAGADTIKPFCAIRGKFYANCVRRLPPLFDPGCVPGIFGRRRFGESRSPADCFAANGVRRHGDSEGRRSRGVHRGGWARASPGRRDAARLRRFQDRYTLSGFVERRRSLGSRRLDCICFGEQQSWNRYCVSPSQVPVVEKYIANQEAHHGKHSFEEEFTTLLRICGVEFDPRFVFG